ncbi:DNA mismatch repair endonuclease MutL [Pseudidiomarina sp. WS423]|uniref:DNA mismatch repair endonuclease MutL n=1 Tax=Pseudidiomarina sp. WS423 TaxID=3425124 RepID=UPI003D6E3106
MPIQLLPISLANQIAAGEVIERPASVVKELVENCLDAGASHIVIDIEQGGRRRIRIRDDGTGIVKAELGLALSRHATSKISSLNDLEAIQSLGFRGEALASISSVSRLTLTSKPAQQAEAWQAWVEGRDMQAEIAPASHPDGTTVDVQDLFFNTPARRKFLRTDKTEFAHIDEVVRRIALARFGVRFSLNHNDKPVRNYPAVSAQQDALQRISQVCGRQFTDPALAVEHASGPVRLWGWVAAPEECRHQADIQYFYVNGRMMKDRLLAHAVRQAYGEASGLADPSSDSMGQHRVPTFVLYLELPPQDVDVNVHPAKHEVRFHQARQIHDFVLAALRTALQQAPSTARSGATAAPHGAGAADASKVAAAPPQHGYQPASSQLSQQVQELQPRHSQLFPQRAQAHPSLAQLQQVAAPSQSESAVTGPKLLSVIQQRFALLQQVELGSQQHLLALLDLAAVQQYVLSKQLQQQWQLGLAGQPLLIPLQLQDAPLIAALRAVPAEQLARLGVRCEFGRNRVTLLEVPSMLRQTNLTVTLAQLVKQLDSPQLFRWLAQFQVLSQFNLSQAEHWLQQWLQDPIADYLYALSLPPEVSSTDTAKET